MEIALASPFGEVLSLFCNTFWHFWCSVWQVLEFWWDSVVSTQFHPPKKKHRIFGLSVGIYYGSRRTRVRAPPYIYLWGGQAPGPSWTGVQPPNKVKHLAPTNESTGSVPFVDQLHSCLHGKYAVTQLCGAFLWIKGDLGAFDVAQGQIWWLFWVSRSDLLVFLWVKASVVVQASCGVFWCWSGPVWVWIKSDLEWFAE